MSAGCGNQMYRQPSFTPLDSPRAAPPTDSVPVSAARMPNEGRPVQSAAYGDAQAMAATLNSVLPNSAFPNSVLPNSAFPSKEPDLPPPNLSDNARNEPAPAQVNALKNPLSSDPRLVRAGQIMFLNRCVQCHSPSGYGVGPVGKYLLPPPPGLASSLVQKRSDVALFWHITMGQGKMPGFRHWTSPMERWTLVAFVRSLRFAKPGALSAGTEGAPYPVFGALGFERGLNATAYKVLPVDSIDPHVQTNRPGERPQTRNRETRNGIR